VNTSDINILSCAEHITFYNSLPDICITNTENEKNKYNELTQASSNKPANLTKTTTTTYHRDFALHGEKII